MFKSKRFYIIGIVSGLCLVGMCLLLRYFLGDGIRTFAGLGLGIGSSIASSCAVNLWMFLLEEKNPEIKRQNKIAVEDERNTFIRNKAKARTADIIQWVSLGTAYVNIGIDGEMWLTLLIVGVFVLQHLMSVYFLSKYQREL